MNLRLSFLFLSAVVAAPLHAQEHAHTEGMKHAEDGPALDSLKARGQKAMKVDQDRSAHLFDALPDGGRIELQAETDDPTAIAGIREHFAEIEKAFRAGDFTIPMFVHDGVVPGTDVMREGRDRIRYERRDLRRGAELRLRTTDADVLAAIRQFMLYQRTEHRAAGKN